MKLAKIRGAAVIGVDATIITMEVHIIAGFKYFIVGLPDNAIMESKFRVEAAIRHSGFEMPRQKIVVNMAPADIRKEGSSYDLPIAVGILTSSGQLSPELKKHYLIMGELSLDGKVKPIKGALPIALCAKENGFAGIIIPRENAREAAVVEGLEVYGVATLQEVTDLLEGRSELAPTELDAGLEYDSIPKANALDFTDVKGQEHIKRALEISAAGGHNAILIGPPGAGKTMLAKRLPSILPPLSLDEALETTKIHSVAGKLPGNTSMLGIRPFRSPHHTISDVALVGGGTNPQPGEISLAHNGVLFLDELPEFKRNVLEVLRQPMEERLVSISRARFSVDYPASFMLVASMNPCPCGFYNHPDKDCMCNPARVQQYLNRISGPLLDRIDLHVEVTPVAIEELGERRESEKSATIRERVMRARAIQEERFEALEGVYCNAQMPRKEMMEHCRIDDAGKQMLSSAINKLGLSARAYDRILKVGRTVADLAGEKQVQPLHLAEAIQYRSLDREGWAG